MINSCSSRLVSTITINRNPEGREENWLSNNLKFYRLPSGRARFAAEIAYGFTAVAAIVETVVSLASVILSVPLTLVSLKPLQKSVQWLESSSFTIIWSTAYLYFNLNVPNLLSREDLSRNIALRGDIDCYTQAPVSSRLLMLVREMPSFLSTAYALRFKDVEPEHGIISGLFKKIWNFKQLIRELIRGLLNPQISQSIFEKNIKKLDKDFENLNKEIEKTKKFICAYFVSAYDHNGAILGDHLYYYHHYKIGKLKEHFSVSAKVIRTHKEMFQHLKTLKTSYPDRPIKIVDIVAHGSSDDISIGENRSPYQIDNVKKDEFRDCAPDAAIILDACSTGSGNNSIAKKMAEQNSGKRIFAPEAPLFFSKPVFSIQNKTIRLDYVIHGFAILNAYTSKEFRFEDS